MTKPKPIVSTDPASEQAVKPRRARRGKDPMEAIQNDAVLGPIVERSFVEKHRWGRLEQITPAEAILEEVQRTQALIKWIEEVAEKAGGLDLLAKPKPARWMYEAAFDETSPVHAKAKELVEEGEKAENVRAIWGYYQMTREHLANISARAEQIRLAERMVAINEGRAQKLWKMVVGLFADPRLGLTPAQQALLPGLFRTHITSVVRSDAALAAIPASND